jgi:hypothetical protein
MCMAVHGCAMEYPRGLHQCLGGLHDRLWPNGRRVPTAPYGGDRRLRRSVTTSSLRRRRIVEGYSNGTLLFPEVTPRSLWLAERLPSGIYFSVSSGDRIEWCTASAAFGKRSQGYGAELIGANYTRRRTIRDPHPSGTRRRVNAFVQIRCLHGET